MDQETFLITMYVEVDDYCQCHPERENHPGPAPSLSRAEAITLALFSQFRRFASERDFCRFAHQCLRPLFPHFPAQSQFNRLVRRYQVEIEAFQTCLCRRLLEWDDTYEAIDGCAVVTRDRRRRGEGWLFGLTTIGKSNRLGFYEGLRLLDAASPCGVITGYGVGTASTNDQKLFDQFLVLRHLSPDALPSVGQTVCSVYLADKGLSGDTKNQTRKEAVGVLVLSAPQEGHGTPWPKEDRKALASLRQIIETVHDKLLHTFRLDSERPHGLKGFLARLAAKVALHNFCIWLNRHLGRPNLAFADLLGWT